MFIEAGLIERPSLGVYKLNKNQQITLTVTKQLFIESFKTNNLLESIQEYQLRDPYFLFTNY